MEFKDFFRKHEGKDIIVLGCGTSVSDFVGKIPPGSITIGVNDIGAIYDPEYLLVVNSPRTFHPESRVDTIINNKSKFFITHLADKWPGISTPVVNIKLGNARLSNISDKPTNIIDYHNNSPFMACICAYYMGARRIGLIGVDFTDNHFNNNDGVHKLAKNLDTINEKYRDLHKRLGELGCDLYNISPISNITSIPKLDQDDFISGMDK